MCTRSCPQCGVKLNSPAQPSARAVVRPELQSQQRPNLGSLGYGPLQHDHKLKALGRNMLTLGQSRNLCMPIGHRTNLNMRWSCNHTHYCIDYICYVTLYTPPLPIRRFVGGDGRYSSNAILYADETVRFPIRSSPGASPVADITLVFPLSLTLSFPVMISHAFRHLDYCESLFIP